MSSSTQSKLVQDFDLVHRIVLTVSDLERAIHWYTTSFRCEVVAKERLSAILQFQNVQIQLSLPSKQPAHIAYLKSDAAAFGELRKTADGAFSTLVSDPAGNIVELIRPPSSGEQQD